MKLSLLSIVLAIGSASAFTPFAGITKAATNGIASTSGLRSMSPAEAADPVCGAATAFLASIGKQNLDDDDLRSDERHTLVKHLDYDDDIQTIIDVSVPYYKLENESLVHTPSSCKQTRRRAFVCTVDPEMPFGRESSPISSAEAGRHMAIAGSVAAALNQPDGLGKHYYLALKNHIRASLPDDDEIFGEAIKDHTNKRHIYIYAVCTELVKRSATCQIVMVLPTELGGGVRYLSTTYSVISKKIFQRKFFKRPQESCDAGTKESYKETTLPSPYAVFEDPHPTFDSIEIISPGIKSRNDEVVTIASKISEIPRRSCLGHFDGYPVFPIAFMAAYKLDLIAKSIEVLSSEAELPFKLRTNPFDESAAGIRLIEGDIEAFQLVPAETHGLQLVCDAERVEGTTYAVTVKTFVLGSRQQELVSIANFLFRLKSEDEGCPIKVIPNLEKSTILDLSKSNDADPLDF